MSPLVATLLLGPLALAPADDLAGLRAAHARALAELGRGALEERLFNDAERLFEQARAWSPDVAGVPDALAALATMRRERIAEPARAAYRAFLESEDFARARAALAEAEARAVAATRAAALERARAGEGEPARAALELALDLGLDDPALEEAVGAREAQGRRAAWEDARGRGRLELGERLAGPPLAPDALGGKVVLWRSFSL